MTLESWSTDIRRRAEGVVRNSGKPGALATALRERVQSNLKREGLGELAVGLNDTTVEGWLNGTCLPVNIGMAAALFSAIELPKLNLVIPGVVEPKKPAPESGDKSNAWRAAEAAFGNASDEEPAQAKPVSPLKESWVVPEGLTGLPLALAQKHLALLKAYESFDETLKHALGDIPTTKVRTARKGPAKENAPALPPAEAPSISQHLPHRVTRENESYSVKGLSEKMDETRNAAEFLTLFRKRYGQHSLDEKTNLTKFLADTGLTPEALSALESGSMLPDVHQLERMRPAFSGADYTRYEDLIISNRLRAHAALEQQMHTLDFSGKRMALLDEYDALRAELLSEMPPRYWAHALEQCNHPIRAEKEKLRNAHGWEKLVLPIECKEEYLAASRMAMGWRLDDAARAANLTVEAIEKMENSEMNPASREGHKLAKAYENAMPRHGLEFRIKTFDRLAVAYDPVQARQNTRAENAARRTAHGDILSVERSSKREGRG